MRSPIIIIPDTTPLIHLAAGELLHLLPAMGRVVVPDLVRLEATRLPTKPWAAEIAAWFVTVAVEVVDTELGGIYRHALVNGLKPAKNAGEISIIEWLRGNLLAQGTNALLVFEDTRVPRMLAVEVFKDRVAALTTLDFLGLAQDQGIIPSAAEAFYAIEKRVPTVSRMSRRNPKNPSP